MKTRSSLKKPLRQTHLQREHDESKNQSLQLPNKTPMITRSRTNSSCSQLSYVSDHSKEIRKRGRPKKKAVSFHSVVRVKVESP